MRTKEPSALRALWELDTDRGPKFMMMEVKTKTVVVAKVFGIGEATC